MSVKRGHSRHSVLLIFASLTRVYGLVKLSHDPRSCTNVAEDRGTVTLNVTRAVEAVESDSMLVKSRIKETKRRLSATARAFR